ncbi:hypothetical protein ABI59_14335 [Acidobacteria bacterium Mor1]|nr:hypothetical protein ABI59_14335 [Acidobacteria bacterium Mor1]
MIVADDLGVDKLCRYRGDCDNPPPDLPETPFLNGMMDRGIRFDGAWSNPVCSTTRATIQTGQYSRRTGILGGLGPRGSGILPEHVTIPDMLAAVTGSNGPDSYQTAAIGKWHLNAEEDEGHDAPVAIAGYDFFAGTPANLGREEPLAGQSEENYCGFKWFTFPESGPNPEEITTYATSHTIDEAIEWIETADKSRPWFVYVALHAPHDPFQQAIKEPLEVPWDVNPEITEPVYSCGPILDPHGDNPPPRQEIVDAHTTMIEAMDREIGVLLEKLQHYALQTDESHIDFPTVIFLGDNGTDKEALDLDFYPQVDGKFHGKTTVFQGGVHVPLIASGAEVSGPHVASRAVNTTDLFFTVAQLAGADLSDLNPPRPIDSFSLVPFFDGSPPDCTVEEPCRPGVYAEILGGGAVLTDGIRPASDSLAVRSSDPALGDYKLVRGCLDCTDPQTPELIEACAVTDCVDGDCLYNIAADPAELVKLQPEDPCPGFINCGAVATELDALLMRLLDDFADNDPELAVVNGCLVDPTRQ